MNREEYEISIEELKRLDKNTCTCLLYTSLMKRLQMACNKPIALIGGGTAMIGDPSGRTDMRQMMTTETIQMCIRDRSIHIMISE